MTIQPEPVSPSDSVSPHEPERSPETFAAPNPAASFLAAEQGRILGRARNWMAWIAVLSIVNIAFTVAGSDFSFAIGLVVSQLAAVVGSIIGEETHIPAIGWAMGAIGAVPALAFGGLWYAARPERSWVWAVAAIAYALDLLVLVLVLAGSGEMDVIGIGIHLWALWSLGNGYLTARKVQTGA